MANRRFSDNEDAFVFSAIVGWRIGLYSNLAGIETENGSSINGRG